ncbi:MAG: DPP IV N-terminal domain-containing protein [Sphingomonas sp.]
MIDRGIRPMRSITLAAGLALFALVGPAGASDKEPARVTRTGSVDGMFSPDGKTIVFATNRASRAPQSYDIWLVDSDGTNPRPLSSDPAMEETPAFSPDGTRVAYASERDGNSEIYVKNVDGSGEVRLTNDPGMDIHPIWLSDGSGLIFNSSRRAKNAEDPEIFDIFSIRPDGTGLRQITRHNGVSTYASVSPDGRRLLFRRVVDGNSEVFVANADGSNEVNLTNKPGFDGWALWSPDSKRIVFVSDRTNKDALEIYLMNADGTGVVQLTHANVRSFAPGFSPDGRKILYTQSGQGIADLYLIDVPAEGGVPAP